jgi:hypothetical protein
MAKWFQISELWRYFTEVVSTDMSHDDNLSYKQPAICDLY